LFVLGIYELEPIECGAIGSLFYKFAELLQVVAAQGFGIGFGRQGREAEMQVGMFHPLYFAAPCAHSARIGVSSVFAKNVLCQSNGQWQSTRTLGTSEE
jgi:hypothetical protein